MEGDAAVPETLSEEFDFVFGTSEGTLDDKGRILFDKSKREYLGKDFVMVWGELEQLAVYPKRIWQKMVREIAVAGPNNFYLQQYVRLFFSYAQTDCNFDGQGRVVIPSRLRSLAHLEDKVTIVGALFRLEIWSKRDYELSQKDFENYNRSRREAVENAYAKLKGAAAA